MSIGLLFWVIWIISVVFGLWSSWPVNVQSSHGLLFWVLTGLLGWGVFGFPIHG